LIAEKQRFLVSMSEGGGGELGNKKELLEGEARNGDVSAELGELVLVGRADLLDDAVKA
jgi:hypothetical protein